MADGGSKPGWAIVVSMGDVENPDSAPKLDRVQWRLLLMALGLFLIWWGIGWTWATIVDSGRRAIAMAQAKTMHPIEFIQYFFFPVFWFLMGCIGLGLGIWLIRSNSRVIHRLTWRLTR